MNSSSSTHSTGDSIPESKPVAGAELIRLAAELAARAHHGQYRRDGLTPYITHPAAVAGRVDKESPEVVATAWLHDVVEDTSETLETLRRAGIPGSVVDAVGLLTKDQSGLSYENYLARVRANPIACRVKVADMLHNLSDAPTQKQILKYARGLLILLEDQERV